jgi:large subunit ribosomal protein L35
MQMCLKLKEDILMPKQKTHSGAKKRFKLTKNGLVKYQKTNKRHRLTQKATKRKRIARTAGFAGPANASTVKQLIPYK